MGREEMAKSRRLMSIGGVGMSVHRWWGMEGHDSRWRREVWSVPQRHWRGFPGSQPILQRISLLRSFRVAGRYKMGSISMSRRQPWRRIPFPCRRLMERCSSKVNCHCFSKKGFNGVGYGRGRMQNNLFVLSAESRPAGILSLRSCRRQSGGRWSARIQNCVIRTSRRCVMGGILHMCFNA
jgi:hypothetical protein